MSLSIQPQLTMTKPQGNTSGRKAGDLVEAVQDGSAEAEGRIADLEAAGVSISALLEACTARVAAVRSRVDKMVVTTPKATTTLAPPPMDKVEADTHHSEEVDLNALLLPDGKLPLDVSNFGLWYNKAALDGWVKQHSPACAAASVAGAWNTLLNRHRHDDAALNQDQVVALMKESLQEKINARCKKLSAQLGRRADGDADGEVDIQPLIVAFRESMVAEELTPFVFKKGTKKKSTIARVRKLLDDDETYTAPIFVALREVVAAQAAAGVNDDGEATGNGAGDGDNDNDSNDNNDNDDEEEEEEEDGALSSVGDSAGAGAGAVAATFTVSATSARKVRGFMPPRLAKRLKEAKKKEAAAKAASAAAATAAAGETSNEVATEVDVGSGAGAGECDGTSAGGEAAIVVKKAGVKWKSALLEIFRVQAGLEKLSRPRPSTGFFGNWGIHDASRRLVDKHDISIDSGTFMTRAARGSPAKLKLSSKDSDETVTEQWHQFREQFAKKSSVLLFHLTNHYALIYGVREWVKDGVVTRQVLTTRRGQRPNTWLDFAEVRQICLKWAGYKMLHLTLNE